MTFLEFKTNVWAKCSQEVPDSVLRFATEYYKELGREQYYASDVADCIILARKICTFKNIARAELELLNALKTYEQNLKTVLSIKQAVFELVAVAKDIEGIRDGGIVRRYTRKRYDKRTTAFTRGSRRPYARKQKDSVRLDSVEKDCICPDPRETHQDTA